MFTPEAMAVRPNGGGGGGGAFDPMGFLHGPGGVAAARGRRDRSSVESDETTASGEDARRVMVRKPGVEDEHELMPEAGVTCACCRTQKTPLWRNGPTGVKTLCNACGVRFKNGRIVVDAATGDVVAVPAPGRKRPAPDEIMSHLKKHAANNPAATFRGTSFAYKHVHDARLIELERVGARDAFPRVHSATILTDYDGAVLLMLLHDGDGSDEDEE